MKKRAKLEKLVHTQPATPPENKPNGEFKRPNFKLTLKDWTKLKIMALERNTSLENLLLEAIQDFFLNSHKDNKSS